MARSDLPSPSKSPAVALMDWLSGKDVLPLQNRSPEYRAVIACTPAASALVVSVARSEASRGRVPREVAPSKKVTVPVGVPVAGGKTATVAVNVTGWPTTAGFRDDATAV